jgi:hypothetical protein
LAGLAINDETTGGAIDRAGATVTVTDADKLPEALVAVKVYVVVTDGEMATAPLSLKAAPIPGWMETVSAPLTIHIKLEDCPGVIVCGQAWNAEITG